MQKSLVYGVYPEECFKLIIGPIMYLSVMHESMI